MMDRWLGWVDSAPVMAESKRAVLSERDLIVRRAIAERDPDNKMAVQLFGANITDKLVQTLWGGDRLRENN